MPCCELMTKKLYAFLLANLIKLEPGGEPLFQELQGRLLEPDQEARGRQQQHCRAFPTPILRALENLLDLLIGELVRVGQHEQRRGGLRGFQYGSRTTAWRWRRNYGA